MGDPDSPLDSPLRSAEQTLPADADAALPPVAGPRRGCLIVIRGRALGRVLALPDHAVTVGRADEADLRLDDSGVSRVHARVEWRPEGYVLRDLNSTNGVFVNGERVEARPLRDGDRVQLGSGTVLKFRFQDALEEDAQRRLYESATRDPLTGAFNRRYLLETLESDLAYGARHRVPVSLLILDLDLFKSINDRLGHLGGDHALREVAAAVQEELRAEDVLARYGGEEFAVVLRHATAAEATAAAERIRRGVERHEIEFEGASFRITVSVGVATLEPGGAGDVQSLMAAADAALYRAKAGGRNRVEGAGGHEEPRSGSSS